VFEEGAFHVAGAADRAIDIQEVARLAHEEGNGTGGDGGLEATETRTSEATFPFGTHVAVVEVDAGTGEVDLVDYVAVDDAGVPLNPTLIEGQIVGGVVQGIGQAVYEDAVYDEAGTLTNGSLMDYAMPRAEHLPPIRTDHTVTPSPYNALGVKGAGESGAAAAPSAVANAVADALAPLGIDHVDLPMTPERVWRAMRDAESS
jgi:carbon-monoxide dehydrogenase large subunit